MLFYVRDAAATFLYMYMLLKNRERKRMSDAPGNSGFRANMIPIIRIEREKEARDRTSGKVVRSFFAFFEFPFRRGAS